MKEIKKMIRLGVSDVFIFDKDKHLNVCDISSVKDNCIEYWNDKAWHPMRVNSIDSIENKQKLFHFALYIQNKYPKWYSHD